MTSSELSYQSGFGNEFNTEALPGVLPEGQNSPQRVAYGLYAEQLSGAAFTAPRHVNRRSWLYRIRPAAMHSPFAAVAHASFHNRFDEAQATPNQLRWDPLPLPTAPTDFVDGLVTIAGNGGAALQAGCGIHLYAANRSMEGKFFYDADGELLIVPQQGRLRIATELGILEVAPLEIALIPRGVRFRVELPDGEARGYIAENFGELLRLPDLGPIGANGLAGARDFLAPVAAYEDVEGEFELDRQVPGFALVGAHRPFAAGRGRLARQLRAVQIRPEALQHDRHDQLRPSRSVDLHRADLAERYAWHGEYRFRDLPATLAGRRAHLPAAVFPSQRGQRIHGPDRWCLRRQGRRLRAGRREPAQLHERPRSGRDEFRESQQRGRRPDRTISSVPWPSCSRRAKSSIRPRRP